MANKHKGIIRLTRPLTTDELEKFKLDWGDQVQLILDRGPHGLEILQDTGFYGGKPGELCIALAGMKVGEVGRPIEGSAAYRAYLALEYFRGILNTDLRDTLGQLDAHESLVKALMDWTFLKLSDEERAELNERISPSPNDPLLEEWEQRLNQGACSECGRRIGHEVGCPGVEREKCSQCGCPIVGETVWPGLCSRICHEDAQGADSRNSEKSGDTQNDSPPEVGEKPCLKCGRLEHEHGLDVSACGGYES